MRRLIFPAVMTAGMLAVLIGLGMWQVHRLHWKLGVLASIDRAEAADPVPLTDDPAPFSKVVVRGTWGEEVARFRSSVRNAGGRERLGSDVIQPLLRDGPAVLIDRGWLPDDVSDVARGPATVVGYVRAPERANWAMVGDDLPHLHFYTLNPAAIGRALGLAVAPLTVVALGEANGALPMPATALPRPPNDHLQYAITWFGLAAALAVVFGAWARRSPARGLDGATSIDWKDHRARDCRRFKIDNNTG